MNDFFALILGKKRGKAQRSVRSIPKMMPFSEHKRDAMRLMTLVEVLLALSKVKRTEILFLPVNTIINSGAYRKVADNAKEYLCCEDLDILVEQGVCVEQDNQYSVLGIDSWPQGFERCFMDWQNSGSPLL
jgi:hypothetical protein